jgi:hypothetical protein
MRQSHFSCYQHTPSFAWNQALIPHIISMHFILYRLSVAKFPIAQAWKNFLSTRLSNSNISANSNLYLKYFRYETGSQMWPIDEKKSEFENLVQVLL